LFAHEEFPEAFVAAAAPFLERHLLRGDAERAPQRAAGAA
jgi:hypothetical protein